MTDKINLTSAGSGYNLTVINDNFTKIETALNDRVLYRDVRAGEVNSLLSDLDANGKRIYNLPAPIDLNEAARLQDIQDAVSGATSANLISADDGASGSIFTTVQGFITKILSNAGSSIVGFLQAGTGAILRSVQDKLRERVSVKDFGAIGDGVNNDGPAIQAAIDYLYSIGGGTAYVPESSAFYRCDLPIILRYGVSLKGASAERSILQKDTTSTLTLANSATSLAGGYPVANLPSDINAVLVLDGPTSDHRYVGTISDICFRGTFSGSGVETPKVEFGIVSLGSVSDYRRLDCKIENVQYGELYPVIFVAKLKNTRTSTCLHGLFINNGTSTAIEGNYMNGCRDYGYYIRDLKYSQINGNACDFLNDPTKYPTRTRTCSAYVFRSVIGLTVVNNGDENTYGRSIEFNEFDHSIFTSHTSISIGSDYTGVDEIAWIYSTSTMRGSTVCNNVAYSVKASGLTSGGANPAKHHNIYFEGLTTVQQVEFNNNIVRAARTGSIVEAGWGNNVPTTWINAARGENLVFTHSPTFTAQTVGDLAVVYGSDNRHYLEQKGSLLHAWGCFHVTVTYTTATGLIIINNFPTNGTRQSAFDIIGVGGGGGFATKGGWFEFSAGSTGGVGRTDDDGNWTINSIPTGSQVRIHYDGWYSLT